MMLLLVVLLLFLLLGGGGAWNYRTAGYASFSPLLIFVVLIFILWVCGVIPRF